MFFLMDTMTIDAAIKYNVVMDERQMHAAKAFLIITLTTLYPRLELFLTPSDTFLLSVLVNSCISCVAVPTTITRSDETDVTQASSNQSAVRTDVEALDTLPSWIQILLDLIREYKMNMRVAEEAKAHFCIAVGGSINISAIKIESKIEQFLLMLRIFNSKIRHHNEHFVTMRKKSTHEVTLAIQDVKLLLTEKATSDANDVFRGSMAAVAGSFRRYYEQNGLQNTLRFIIDKLKLNYIIGSSFAVTTSEHKLKNEQMETDVLVKFCRIIG
ncbi:unnamed protein product [Gongylonema pulchrum]|uniref:Uncharacterized protein n=1 Tax=Gongylonema pulchrum TaxID=637853 RepID=A0A3P6PMG1_9BILA|nr:unnamed protein product [Gongylonema pulchrum]